MSERNDGDIDNTKFLYAFTKSILNSDTSIRWVGITDQNGIIINERYREGVKPLLTIEENHEYIVTQKGTLVVDKFYIPKSLLNKDMQFILVYMHKV